MLYATMTTIMSDAENDEQGLNWSKLAESQKNSDNSLSCVRSTCVRWYSQMHFSQLQVQSGDKKLPSQLVLSLPHLPLPCPPPLFYPPLIHPSIPLPFHFPLPIPIPFSTPIRSHSLPFPIFLPFSVPLPLPKSFPTPSLLINSARWSEERCELPQRGPKSNLVHFSRKIGHHVTTVF